MSMTLVQTVTVTSNVVSINFNSIPQDADDLYITLSARGNSTTEAERFVSLWMNTGFDFGPSGSRSLRGNGSSVSSIQQFYGLSNLSNTTANTFSNNSIYIPNYKSSVNKSVSWDAVSENNATLAEQWISAGTYSLTSAITALMLYGNFVAGTTASLYKITKA